MGLTELGTVPLSALPAQATAEAWTLAAFGSPFAYKYLTSPSANPAVATEAEEAGGVHPELSGAIRKSVI